MYYTLRPPRPSRCDPPDRRREWDYLGDVRTGGLSPGCWRVESKVEVRVPSDPSTPTRPPSPYRVAGHGRWPREVVGGSPPPGTPLSPPVDWEETTLVLEVNPLVATQRRRGPATIAPSRPLTATLLLPEGFCYFRSGREIGVSLHREGPLYEPLLPLFFPSLPYTPRRTHVKYLRSPSSSRTLPEGRTEVLVRSRN